MAVAVSEPHLPGPIPVGFDVLPRDMRKKFLPTRGHQKDQNKRLDKVENRGDSCHG